MNKNIRGKAITIVIVLIVFAAVGVYPLIASYFGVTQPSWLMAKQLKLGLDLKGGVHLVLRVQTDDAIRAETAAAAERPRAAGRTRTMPGTSPSPPGIRQVRVGGVPPAQDAAFRDAGVDLTTNYDRSP